MALPLTDADIARWQFRVLVTATCHVWMGAVSPDGYGRFGLRPVRGGPQRTVTPHQVAAQLGFGPVPAGETLLHDCDFRLCCRTDTGHLRLGTQAENVRQAVARGRLVGPHPGRVDVRGPQGVGWAVQAALRAATDRTPGELATVMREVLDAGDPLAGTWSLFDLPGVAGPPADVDRPADQVRAGRPLD